MIAQQPETGSTASSIYSQLKSDFMTLEEAVDVLRCSERRVKELCDSGTLRHKKVPHGDTGKRFSLLIVAESLRDYVQKLPTSGGEA